MIKTHYLKISLKYYNEVVNQNKHFELRKNDRDYKVGDFVCLLEHCFISGYTGNSYELEIKYILKDVPLFGLKKGYCIFSW